MQGNVKRECKAWMFPQSWLVSTSFSHVFSTWSRDNEWFVARRTMFAEDLDASWLDCHCGGLGDVRGHGWMLECGERCEWPVNHCESMFSEWKLLRNAQNSSVSDLFLVSGVFQSPFLVQEERWVCSPQALSCPCWERQCRQPRRHCNALREWRKPQCRSLVAAPGFARIGKSVRYMRTIEISCCNIYIYLGQGWWWRRGPCERSFHSICIILHLSYGILLVWIQRIESVSPASTFLTGWLSHIESESSSSNLASTLVDVQLLIDLIAFFHFPIRPWFPSWFPSWNPQLLTFFSTWNPTWESTGLQIWSDRQDYASHAPLAAAKDSRGGPGGEASNPGGQLLNFPRCKGP